MSQNGTSLGVESVQSNHFNDSSGWVSGPSGMKKISKAKKPHNLNGSQTNGSFSDDNIKGINAK